MSLIGFDGMNAMNVSIRSQWGGSLWSGSTTGRDGSADGASYSGAGLWTFDTPLSSFVIGVACHDDLAAGYTGDTVLFAPNIGTTSEWSVQSRSTGQVVLVDHTNTVVASSSVGIIATDTWFYLEVKGECSTSSTTTVVRVDGVEVINYTGALSADTGDATSFWLESPGNGTCIYDDLYILDQTDGTSAQGRAYDDFLGDIKVATLFPDGAGSNADWTPSTGSNYTCVDDNPPNTSDYVSTEGVGDVDTYAFDDLPGGATAVYGVQVMVYGQKTDAGYAGVRPVVIENSVQTEEDTSLALTTSWRGKYGQMHVKRPSDDALWTVSDVNDLEAGFESVAS